MNPGREQTMHFSIISLSVHFNQPALSAAVCLSVTRKIKTTSSRTYVCGLWGGMAGGYSAYMMLGYWDGAFQPFLGQ